MKHQLQEKPVTSTQLIDGLAHLLADTYVLYLKTQNFHWNVTGVHFHSFHKMFEHQYEELAEAVDVIAERMRSMGAHTPASFKEFLALTSLKESAKNLDWHTMLKTLWADHQHMSTNLTKLFKLAQEANDEVTLDLFIQRKAHHDKTAWMLKSSLK